jgi:hypothetical protein
MRSRVADVVVRINSTHKADSFAWQPLTSFVLHVLRTEVGVVTTPTFAQVNALWLALKCPCGHTLDVLRSPDRGRKKVCLVLERVSPARATVVDANVPSIASMRSVDDLGAVDKLPAFVVETVRVFSIVHDILADADTQVDDESMCQNEMDHAYVMRCASLAGFQVCLFRTGVAYAEVVSTRLKKFLAHVSDEVLFSPISAIFLGNIGTHAPPDDDAVSSSTEQRQLATVKKLAFDLANRPQATPATAHVRTLAASHTDLVKAADPRFPRGAQYKSVFGYLLCSPVGQRSGRQLLRLVHCIADHFQLPVHMATPFALLHTFHAMGYRLRKSAAEPYLPLEKFGLTQADFHRDMFGVGQDFATHLGDSSKVCSFAGGRPEGRALFESHVRAQVISPEAAKYTSLAMGCIDRKLFDFGFHAIRAGLALGPCDDDRVVDLVGAGKVASVKYTLACLKSSRFSMVRVPKQQAAAAGMPPPDPDLQWASPEALRDEWRRIETYVADVVPRAAGQGAAKPRLSAMDRLRANARYVKTAYSAMLWDPASYLDHSLDRDKVDQYVERVRMCSTRAHAASMANTIAHIRYISVQELKDAVLSLVHVLNVSARIEAAKKVCYCVLIPPFHQRCKSNFLVTLLACTALQFDMAVDASCLKDVHALQVAMHELVGVGADVHVLAFDDVMYSGSQMALSLQDVKSLLGGFPHAYACVPFVHKPKQIEDLCHPFVRDAISRLSTGLPLAIRHFDTHHFVPGNASVGIKPLTLTYTQMKMPDQVSFPSILSTASNPFAPHTTEWKTWKDRFADSPLLSLVKNCATALCPVGEYKPLLVGVPAKPCTSRSHNMQARTGSACIIAPDLLPHALQSVRTVKLSDDVLLQFGRPAQLLQSYFHAVNVDKLPQAVTLKVSPAGRTFSAKDIEAVHVEAQSLRRVQGVSGVVKCFGCIISQVVPTQRYAYGIVLEDLSSFAPLEGPVPALLGARIKQCLRNVHDCGVVHGNLTDSTILVSADNTTFRIIDFSKSCLFVRAGGAWMPKAGGMHCAAGSVADDGVALWDRLVERDVAMLHGVLHGVLHKRRRRS